MRCIIFATLALFALTGPGMAQQRVVVPADASIVIPPRGVEGPALVRAPRPRITPPGRPAARPVLETSGGGATNGLALAAPSLIALPLLAAAYLAGTVPGSSSSTSAPARTR